MKLHYTDKGKNTRQTVVFVHGFCESSFIWDDFVTHLSASFRVITVDLPGFGQTPLPYTAPTLLDYAADLHETLEELGIRKHTLIGHSLGGYVALAYAQNHADCLAGLGLFHSTAFADPEPKKETRTKSIDFIKQYGAATFIQNMFGGLFSPSKKEALKAEIASFIKRCCKTEAESIMKTQLAMRDRDEGISVINTLEVPILFIVGKDDQSVSLAQSMEQASMPKDAVVHILEDVAHMGMIEAPQQTLKAVEGFLRYCGE